MGVFAISICMLLQYCTGAIRTSTAGTPNKHA